MSGAEPVADPDGLPGRNLHDQLGRALGKIEEVIDAGDGEHPRWVTVQVRPGAFGTERVVVPLARIKEEDGRLEVPYSDHHLLEAPRPDDPSDIGEEDEQELLAYYGVERGDQPDVGSYSSQGTAEIAPEDIEEPVGDPDDGDGDADGDDGDGDGDGDPDETDADTRPNDTDADAHPDDDEDERRGEQGHEPEREDSGDSAPSDS